MENIQTDTTQIRTSDNGCICIAPEHQTPAFLESTTGSGGTGDGRTPSAVATQGPLPIPTVEVDPESPPKDETREVAVSSTDLTVLANSTLVSHVAADEPTFLPITISNGQVENGRLETIREKRKEQGITETSCSQQTPQIDPKEYNPLAVLQFLTDNRSYAYSALNGFRSSIASKLQEVRTPSASQLKTWDTDIMVSYIHQNYASSENLSLYELQQKTVLLFCLSTMARPRSDVERLQFRDVLFDLSQDKPVSLTLHFREAKETQVKTCTLGLIEVEELCPVRTAYLFTEKSKPLRVLLPADHTYFLAHIDDLEQVNSIRPSTLSSWIKTSMQKAGIDTKTYKPHSVRSASSTKAVEKGSSVDAVKQHANWSLHSNTFEKHYYKPIAQQASSTQIANSIFSTENNTTLEVGVKSTRIALGTTSNTDVDETKTENVVHTRPSFWSRFFW
ncbi:hypothetical protein A0J61_03030 [Choanephora cucurbitarum]|uniref:Uncharacterized protein n=1 Tax=Choanephora cucurbitarum TaxID=101091 RepID=A0A1C7NIH5_9FUNG|nr:hypothetical protein A0J61_03030 [Choanephora cucurbitarum]